MKKKLIKVVVVLAALVFAVVAGFFIYNYSLTKKSDVEIRQLFLCDRVTADVMATDVYCDYPNLYREDVRNNHVLSPEDFVRAKQIRKDYFRRPLGH